MKTFNYVQPTAASTWTIAHNLNSMYPSVDVTIPFQSNPKHGVLPYNITIVNANTIEITFTFSTVGTARLIVS
jgi:hypothetical protein